MTKGLAAGPFGTPDRFATSSQNVSGSWVRSIAIYRTNWVHVQQMQKPTKDLPKELAGITWFGAGAAHYAPFVPVPSGLTRSLTPLVTGMPSKFDRGSLNWACRKIGNICQIRFDKMHPMVEARQRKLETAGAQLVASTAAAFAKSPKTTDLNTIFDGFCNRALQEWNDLADELIFTWSDNTEIRSDAPLGYSDSWLRAVGYQNGPPKPPVETQCPPACPPQGGIIV
jgi:dipeptidase